MNNKDLQEFIEAFDDFMKHFETEELYYEGRMVYENHRAEARRIQEQEILQHSFSLLSSREIFQIF